MITDEMLKEAAGELENAMLAEMPDPKAYRYELSPRFERKMKKLIYRAAHPITASLGFRIAAVILAVLLLGGSVLLVSEDARAAFVGWVGGKREDGSFYYTYYADERPEGVPTHFRLESIPEGYTLWRHNTGGNGEGFVYINDDGTRLLRFTYDIVTENAAGALSISKTTCVHKEVLVNGRHADLLLKDKSIGASHIVWTDYDGAVLFSIAGYLDEDELIYMAEHVISVENTP
ncbi:MAG: DUF4367 domain-containing protein [Ruminococcaceae bacterium]|nr:DUF4367 domain-containing protein [Oscillospiraceae bacterium]